MIHGGRKLVGEVEISGAKNAAVALIPAVILCDGPCILENVPDISDVSICFKILREMGAEVEEIGKSTFRISTENIKNCCVPYESARSKSINAWWLSSW